MEPKQAKDDEKARRARNGRDDDDGDGEDTFDRFRDVAVEQMANLGQLAAEARRLGLIPELPRELLEKLDLGGTLLDLVRLQLKHATALSSILGPQGRNLEKLNQLNALIAKGKSGKPRSIHGEPFEEGVAFEVFVDNPTDRQQNVTVALGNLHSLEENSDVGGKRFTAKPGEAQDERLAWKMIPQVPTVAKHEIRSFRIWIATKVLPRSYEVTATVSLAPLGSYHRYLLRAPKE